jgi:hypothetical protein
VRDGPSICQLRQQQQQEQQTGSVRKTAAVMWPNSRIPALEHKHVNEASSYHHSSKHAYTKTWSNIHMV